MDDGLSAAQYLVTIQQLFHQASCLYNQTHVQDFHMHAQEAEEPVDAPAWLPEFFSVPQSCSLLNGACLRLDSIPVLHFPSNILPLPLPLLSSSTSELSAFLSVFLLHSASLSPSLPIKYSIATL